MKQNAPLSPLSCVISSVAWLLRDTLKVGSFKVRIRGGGKEKERVNEMKKRRVETENGWNKGCFPPEDPKQRNWRIVFLVPEWSRERRAHTDWTVVPGVLKTSAIQGNSKLQSHHFRDKSVPFFLARLWVTKKFQRWSAKPVWNSYSPLRIALPSCWLPGRSYCWGPWWPPLPRPPTWSPKYLLKQRQTGVRTLCGLLPQMLLHLLH